MVRAYFERAQRGDPQRKKIAVVATAHYLVRVMLALLKRGLSGRRTRPRSSSPRSGAPGGMGPATRVRGHEPWESPEGEAYFRRTLPSPAAEGVFGESTPGKQAVASVRVGLDW